MWHPPGTGPVESQNDLDDIVDVPQTGSKTMGRKESDDIVDPVTRLAIRNSLRTTCQSCGASFDNVDEYHLHVLNSCPEIEKANNDGRPRRTRKNTEKMAELKKNDTELKNT